MRDDTTDQDSQARRVQEMVDRRSLIVIGGGFAEGNQKVSHSKVAFPTSMCQRPRSLPWHFVHRPDPSPVSATAVAQ
jgi:hypothetical protein